jgi:hypothetical protein
VGLLLGVLSVGVEQGRTQDHSAQVRSAARIPINAVPPGVRERLRPVLSQPTLYGHGPAELFAGRADLYCWLLTNPDQALRAWQRLGAKCADIRSLGGGKYSWKDGHGSEIHWQVVVNEASLCVWFAEGKVRPGLFLPPVPVRVVLVLRHSDHSDSSERTLIYHQADVFLKTESKTAALATQMLGASAPKVAEQGLRQLELFFSGLVWYVYQHPDRIAELFPANNLETIR